MSSHLAVASENIKAQEAMLGFFRDRVQEIGPGIVAGRLEISESELQRKLMFFGDLTMTELRLLAIATNTKIQYKMYISPDSSAEEFALTR